MTPNPPRITYTFEGGPLDGRVVHHAVDSPELRRERVHRLTTCAKDSDVDMVAQGVYHIEQRKSGFVAIHHEGPDDRDWQVLEVRKDADVDETVKSATTTLEEKPPKRKLRLPEELAKRLAPLVELQQRRAEKAP